jgi:hypothetical protein
MEHRTAAHRFEYKGWSVAVRLESTKDDGTVAGHADLRLGDMPKCRISLAGVHHDGASAVSSLARMARAFIDDWLERDHSGTTDFAAI